MKIDQLLDRALMKASAHTMRPATEVMWHLRAASDFGNRLSEETLRSHLDNAQRHAEFILHAINEAQLELDRATRSTAPISVIPIGNGDAPYQRTLSAVGHEMGAQPPVPPAP